jgi:hypothetical protein
MDTNEDEVLWDWLRWNFQAESLTAESFKRLVLRSLGDAFHEWRGPGRVR